MLIPFTEDEKSIEEAMDLMDSASGCYCCLVWSEFNMRWYEIHLCEARLSMVVLKIVYHDLSVREGDPCN